MSLANRVVATAASRAYLTLLGLLVLPLYMLRMGAEAYGLVVLFTTLQVWFQLLDMGLTATLAREAARHGGNYSSRAAHVRARARLAPCARRAWLCAARAVPARHGVWRAS